MITCQGRPYGPDGCQVPVGSGTCGETRTLEIIDEFRRLYEEKIQEIESTGGGDCLQEKIKLQQDWIGDLTSQNEMLVKAVEELENEATDRVQLLEQKLQQSAQNICEVMKRYREYDVTSDLLAEPLQKVFCMESDQKNLLEFIRRVREENRWDVHGLKFYEVSYTDLFGASRKDARSDDETQIKTCDCNKREKAIKDKECCIKELQKKLANNDKFGDAESLSKNCADKNEECINLQKSMKDTQQALVEEIASKHDAILQMKKECQQLEERCVQADKQTAFRDDIIKELRKEIKQLRQQKYLKAEEANEALRKKIQKLENDNNSLAQKNSHLEKEKAVLEIEKGALQKEKKSLENQNTSLQNDKKSLESENKSLQKENDSLHEQRSSLERRKCCLEDDKRSLEKENCAMEKEKCALEAANKSLEKEMCCLEKEKCCSEKEKCSLQKKNKSLLRENKALEDEKNSLEQVLKDNKSEVDGLAKDFNAFLNSKAQLKKLAKLTEKRCREVTDKNKKLKEENHILKADIKNLAEKNTELEDELIATKEFSKRVQCKTIVCEAKDKENESLVQQVYRLNEENRDLLKTVETQKKKLDRSSKLTQDEMTKLNSTIDELHNDLEKTKLLQEDEERKYQDTISQLTVTIQSLTNSLKEAEEKYEKDLKNCKICRGRRKVAFAENAEVQACVDEDDSDEQMESIQKRDEIIKVQSDTLDILQEEIESLRAKESELKQDRDRKYGENQELRNQIAELENSLEDAEGKAANLQTAVDLYLNSISVLETSEDQYKVEIEQQKLTISNLQKALVAAKQELDEIRQRSQENEHEQHSLIACFNVILSDMEVDKENWSKKCESLSEDYEHLQDMNFDLEVEHCTSLQDVDILENQLYKYQTLLRSSEDECNQYKNYCKKLAKQKKCYEEVVAYFKQEMGSMAEQLCSLQELLTLSSESNQEETCKLVQAYKDAQEENEELCTRLAAAEQKADLESQMNQLNETKICELQQLISERELDLSRHDQAIYNIRQSLQCSLAQNEELQSTIVELHETIAQLQEAVGEYEEDNSKGKVGTEQCWAQIICCKDKLEELKGALDDKTADLCKINMAYNDQTRALKSAQMELKEIREKQKDKQRHLKSTVEELREKLGKSEENYCKVCCEYQNLQTQLAALARKETVKDLEVKRYRKIVCDLKNTLIDLNKTLASGKPTQKPQNNCKHAECKKRMQLTEEAKNQDICLKCPCEVEFYQSIVETLKKSVIELKKKLKDTQEVNRELEEASKRRDAEMQELSSEKCKECNELRRKLTDKMKQAQTEETRYMDLASQLEKELNCIRQELEVKTLQLSDVKRSAQEINSSKCIQLVCAQEELNSLREELNRLMRQHCTLNAENEKLHAHSACLQATVSKLEEKSQLLNEQLEQYLSELQSVQCEKDSMVHKNCELLNELRSLQNTFGSAQKQQRYANETVKVLRMEINDLKNYRQEICVDSKKIIDYVRSWMQEQKKINEHVANRERDYREEIQRLKKENKECPYLPPSQRPCKKVLVHPCIKSSPPPPTCPSPWSLGSQGTASVHGGRSPSRSPCLEEDCDWYSSTFRNDSDDDEEEEDEEDWVSKVENLAAEVRRTNKFWKNKMSNPDDVVSRDTKK